MFRKRSVTPTNQSGTLVWSRWSFVQRLRSVQSTKIIKKSEGEYDVTGDMTIRGTTRPETFLVTYEGQAKDPYGNEKVGFSAKGTINRSDYGLTWNAALEISGVMIGDQVQISMEIEASKQGNMCPANCCDKRGYNTIQTNRESPDKTTSAIREKQATFEEWIEQRDKVLIATLRAMQEQAASKQKRGWLPFGRKK